MPGALQDLRVIDFTHALNGPFCTMLLGHLGAEIIKIEPPSGDGFRRSWMPRDTTKDAYEFLWINVNKKSVVLNLKTERGIDLARQLIARADVLVENYQKGTMERFGLDYDSAKSLNPRLIYACCQQQQHHRMDPYLVGLQRRAGDEGSGRRRRSRRRQHGAGDSRGASRAGAHRRGPEGRGLDARGGPRVHDQLNARVLHRQQRRKLTE